MNRRSCLEQAEGGPPDRACRVLDTSQHVSYHRTKVQLLKKDRKGSLHPMARKRQPSTEQQPHARKPTPTFLLELPLQVTSDQAKRLRAHLEAARQLYNAILSE